LKPLPNPKSATLTVKRLPIAKLKPHPRNPRKHPEPGSAEWLTLKKSLESDYFDPIVLNKRNGLLVSGHLRTKILAESGYTEADCVIVDWTEPVHLARMIAANKVNGENDDQALAEIFKELTADDIDLDLTGFTAEELSDFGFLNGSQEADDEHAAELVDKAAELQKKWKTKPSQIWECGPHRVMCGDSTIPADVQRLMRQDRAGLMNTDPPYGVSYDNSDRPNPGVAKPRVAKPRVANDELCDAKLQAFLESAFRAAVAYALQPTAAWYLWHAHLTQGFFAAAAAAAAAAVILHRQIIWVKPVLLLGRGQYHWKHEPCFMGWVKGQQCPDYGRGNGERDQTTIWEIGSITQAERREFGHSTPKPVGIFSIPITKHLKSGEVAFDPFFGSAPQLIACEQLGRKFRGIDKDPRFLAVALQRWVDLTSKTPKLLNG
jgi:DNA modification methylase